MSIAGWINTDVNDQGNLLDYGPLKDLVTFVSAPCLVGVKFCAKIGSFLSRLRIVMGLTVASFCVCEIFNNIFT